jgi:hypothetical protein
MPGVKTSADSVHSVLHPDHHAVGLEVRFDELRHPARLLRLGGQEDDVEFALHRGDVAQVEGAHRHLDLPIRHRDLDAMRPDRRDMLWPLIDQRDIVAGLREVGGDAAADRAGTQHGDGFAHGLPLINKHACMRIETEHGHSWQPAGLVMRRVGSY